MICLHLLLTVWDIAESSSWQLCVPRKLQLADCWQILWNTSADFRF